jgi:hypothetical protein
VSTLYGREGVGGHLGAVEPEIVAVDHPGAVADRARLRGQGAFSDSDSRKHKEQRVPPAATRAGGW